MKTPNPKILEIAQMADVSTATVDRVLHDRSGVRSKTREKVLAAAEALKKGEQSASTRGKKKDLRVCVLLSEGGGSVNQTLRAALKKSAQAADVQLHFESSPRMDAATQAKALNKIRSGGFDGVILQPFEHPLVREEVAALTESGAPVVTLLTSLTHPIGTYYVGLDNRSAGRAAALLLGRLIRKPGKVALLIGGPLYRSHEEREIGFQSVIRRSFDDLRLLQPLDCSDDPDLIYREVTNLLETHDDLVGICSICGGVRGLDRALREAGNRPDLVTIAFNLTHLTRNALVSGTFDAVIHQDMTRIAERAISVIRDNGQNAERVSIVPTEIIMSENVL